MPKHRGEGLVLTKEQMFYIEQKLDEVSEEQMAEDLRLPLQAVRECVAKFRQEKPSRANSLLQRPAPGAVAMTEAASMAADDFRKEQAAAIEAQRDRYDQCWHRIRK